MKKCVAFCQFSVHITFLCHDHAFFSHAPVGRHFQRAKRVALRARRAGGGGGGRGKGAGVCEGGGCVCGVTCEWGTKKGVDAGREEEAGISIWCSGRPSRRAGQATSFSLATPSLSRTAGAGSQQQDGGAAGRHRGRNVWFLCGRKKEEIETRECRRPGSSLCYPRRCDPPSAPHHDSLRHSFFFSFLHTDLTTKSTSTLSFTRARLWGCRGVRSTARVCR